MNENDKNLINDVDQNYIETIKKLKESTVDRADYDKLKAQNKQLLDSVINGTSNDGAEASKKAVKRTPDEIRKDLFGKEHNNLDFISKSLELREALMERGEPDPFLPVGNQITPTNEDVQAAQRVADIFKECVEYAAGDSAIFTNELQRRTIDVYRR